MIQQPSDHKSIRSSSWATAARVHKFYVHMYMYIEHSIYDHTHVHAPTDICIRTHRYTHKHTHKHTHTHTYTHTFTNYYADIQSMVLSVCFCMCVCVRALQGDTSGDYRKALLLLCAGDDEQAAQQHLARLKKTLPEVPGPCQPVRQSITQTQEDILCNAMCGAHRFIHTFSKKYLFEGQLTF